MSVEITTARVEQYRSNVYHLVQQKGSKLRKAVRVETVTGKNEFFEQLGSVAARKRPSRHADTPRMDTPHLRRRVSLTDYDWADLIDKEDEIRNLVNFTSPYAQACAYAMGRSIDDAILEAITATAYTGETGSTSTAFDTNMVVDVQTVWPGVSAADTGLNVAKIVEAKRLLNSNDVDPDDPCWMVINGDQQKSLLLDERISNRDYNTLQALQDGEVAKFGGFNMILCNRLTTDANSDTIVPFWAAGVNNGMLLALGKDMTTKITERADKNYATQVFGCMTIGSTRMEEKKVGYIECDPGASPTTDA